MLLSYPLTSSHSFPPSLHHWGERAAGKTSTLQCAIHLPGWKSSFSQAGGVQLHCQCSAWKRAMDRHPGRIELEDDSIKLDHKFVAGSEHILETPHDPLGRGQPRLPAAAVWVSCLEQAAGHSSGQKGSPTPATTCREHLISREPLGLT